MKFLVSLSIVCLFATSTCAQYSGGSGTADDPYQIWTAEQMNTVGAEPNDWDKCFRLMADVDLAAYSGSKFNIIGNEAIPFSGLFDGGGNRVLNFSYTCADANDIGLFGHVFGDDAEIRNLGLIDPNVEVQAGFRTGALIGYLRRGALIDCYVDGGHVAGDVSVGALVGRNRQSSGRGEANAPRGISGCYSTSDVAGTASVGGLVGRSVHDITRCFATGSVTGIDGIGGLVGYNTYTITACYATGAVTGTDGTGGLVGYNTSFITACYAAGRVCGIDPNVGGLVGTGNTYLVLCYCDKKTSGQTTNCGSRGKTTAQMQTAETFVGWGACGYDEIWTIDEGRDYPRLRWENRPGDVIGLAALSDSLDGTGDPNDPYLIGTAEDWNRLGLFLCDWDKCFELVADIDLASIPGGQLNMIGNRLIPFTGIFDGKGHTIANFCYQAKDEEDVGLFAYASGSKAEIRNLGLIDPNVVVSGGQQIGALVGYLNMGAVGNCCVQGAHIEGSEMVGGLVGRNSGRVAGSHAEGVISGQKSIGGLVGRNSETITDSWSDATTAGDTDVGGLVGENAWGSIHGSYASGDVAGNQYVGGLAGRSSDMVAECCAWGSVTATNAAGGLIGYNSGTIVHAYARGDITAVTNVGGLVGRNYETIVACYSTGRVQGQRDVGGLIGYDRGNVVVAYWDTETSGWLSSAAGQERTTAQMQQAATFYLWGPSDSAGIWTLDEGKDYPRLWWEDQPGQAIGPQHISSLLAGAGTADDPFLIGSAEDLYTMTFFACDWDKHYTLADDIDLSGYDGKGNHPAFKVIGSPGIDLSGNRTEGTPFTGTFDGNGHIIWHLSYEGDDDGHVGLFGDVAGGEIRNLGLVNPRLSAFSGTYVGAIAARLEGGTIANCFVREGRISGSYDIGALVGAVSAGTVTDCDVTGTEVLGYSSVGGLTGYSKGIIAGCYSTGVVSGGNYTGGIVGWNSGSITTSGSAGTIKGSDETGGIVGRNFGNVSGCWTGSAVEGRDYVGGIAGTNASQISVEIWAEGKIMYCYSLASVAGVGSVGGLVGQNYLVSHPDDLLGSVSLCYSSGLVSGNSDIGGLTGRQRVGTVEASFWDVEASGLTASEAGIGVTTDQMCDPNTFRAAGWDFLGPADGPHEIWAVPEGGGYPLLWWQVTPKPALPTFVGGTGSPGDPFQIATVEQLNSIGCNPALMNAHFVLLADVDLAGTEFFPIGALPLPYTGVFEGNGHIISNLALHSESDDMIGLFRVVHGPEAAIQNLILTDPSIAAGTGSQVGALVGRTKNAAVFNCHAVGASISGDSQIGGLVGLCRSGTIVESYAESTVVGNEGVGGLIGYGVSTTIVTSHADGIVAGSRFIGGLAGFCDGSIRQCCSRGAVSGDDSVGGLVGYPMCCVINDCYSTAAADGNNDIGGLVGFNQGNSIRCYATGPVSGNSYAGGFCGYCLRSNPGIESCFWDTVTSGQAAGIGYQIQPDGLLGLPTIDMQTAAPFLEAGWDFIGETANGTEDIWWIDEGNDYPRLWWEALED